MPDASWALVHDDGEPSSHVAGLLVSRLLGDPADASVQPLLHEWARLVDDLAPRAAFGATADNVVRIDDSLRSACDLRDGVDALDDDATRARLCWYLARSLVVAGAAGNPGLTVHDLAVRLAGRCGWAVTDAAVARALAHEARLRAAVDGADESAEHARLLDESAWTMPLALAHGALDPAATGRALAAAWAALARAERDRDTAEAAAIELQASRALAASLGEELKRDEWIRARLRAAKATRPVKAAIELRKRLRR
jgi:hypothetical protein